MLKFYWVSSNLFGARCRQKLHFSRCTSRAQTFFPALPRCIRLWRETFFFRSVCCLFNNFFFFVCSFCAWEKYMFVDESSEQLFKTKCERAQWNENALNRPFSCSFHSHPWGNLSELDRKHNEVNVSIKRRDFNKFHENALTVQKFSSTLQLFLQAPHEMLLNSAEIFH